MYYRSILLRESSGQACLRRYFSSTRSCTTSQSPPFDKLLIANRGEIACRIAKTCRRLGVKTVAVYSEVDGRNALHAQLADECYQIGTGPSAAESYLRGDEILDICHATGAQAIHPAYGFLSENAAFAQTVVDSGLSFVGPPPTAIQAMGSKSHSKRIMEEAGVPTTPGYHGNNQDPEHLLHQAVTTVGFPLLIKAVMGGGGKGMRLVRHEKEFLEALASCKSESQASFGDDSVLLEKYLVHPRHVEVQVMADTHGNAVHLYERDCSLQRRHQKVIEEAPASDLDPVLRAKMGEMGTKAAKAVGYVNAGTVEFLVDTQQQSLSESDNFFFCEMNTRLQVEHPVTELITGLDLVEWQLRIAAGQELPITNQEAIPCQGHAFEARIYAENPMKDFLPATGHVHHHQPPHKTARVDTGIQSGQDISVYYDPMISKLIVYGENRKAALEKLIAALKSYELVGLPTNIDFLIQCAQHDVFQEAGACNTGFLEHYMDDILKESQAATTDSSFYATAAFLKLLHSEQRIGLTVSLEESRSGKYNPWSSWSGSWRVGSRAKRVLTVAGDDNVTIECLSNIDGSFDIGVIREGQDLVDWFHMNGSVDKEGSLLVCLDGSKRKDYSSFVKEDSTGTTLHLWSKDPSDEAYSGTISLKDPYISEVGSEESASSSSQGLVSAPMPGKIVQINTKVGDIVRKDDVLILMEAMKMQHSIRAPRDGIVVQVSCSEDSVVDDGHILVEVDDQLDEAA